ncbi:hypothetical protein EBE87_27485 [Pseudoroseomonas wenyumeiae]|uniref:Uncharacterized protein n=1 Tax=Teichococcus wenyumeiae TaxID=2478470 RepID=A0A3A9J9G4_9PROT|nr:hypothetical protein [Pseudoroseomonas wenyumeiae]RKK01363.1 hypothetical protein D6Z83_25335 [Pseudoroseomonas wenyumeiae]RMI14670.1 hypothetical protein EBE87_27485 [Pseudoroseomonas wenyumeiae]
MKLKIRSLLASLSICLGGGLVIGGAAIYLALAWSEAANTTVVRDGEVALAVPTQRVRLALDGAARVRHVVAGVSSPVELLITGYLDYSPISRDYPSQVPVVAWEQDGSVLHCDAPDARGGVPVHQSDPCNRARYRQPVVWEPHRFSPEWADAFFPIGEGSFVYAAIPRSLMPRWGAAAKEALSDLIAMKATPTQSFYSRIGTFVTALLVFLFTALAALLVLPVLFPPLGISLLAVLPAVLLGRKRKDMEAAAAETSQTTKPSARNDGAH